MGILRGVVLPWQKLKNSLREKSPYLEFFLVHIFLFELNAEIYFINIRI